MDSTNSTDPTDSADPQEKHLVDLLFEIQLLDRKVSSEN